MSPDRFVIHLPVTADDLTTAIRLARVVTRMLSFLPQLEAGGTTVSEESLQGIRHFAYCDRKMAAGRRCLLPPDHHGPCACGPRLR